MCNLVAQAREGPFPDLSLSDRSSHSALAAEGQDSQDQAVFIAVWRDSFGSPAAYRDARMVITHSVSRFQASAKVQPLYTTPLLSPRNRYHLTKEAGACEV